MSIGHRSKCGMIEGRPVFQIGGRMRKESLPLFVLHTVPGAVRLRPG